MQSETPLKFTRQGATILVREWSNFGILEPVMIMRLSSITEEESILVREWSNVFYFRVHMILGGIRTVRQEVSILVRQWSNFGILGRVLILGHTLTVR